MGTIPTTSQVMRINITPDELRELRVRAALAGTNVPTFLAQLVRRELETATPEMEGAE